MDLTIPSTDVELPVARPIGPADGADLPYWEGLREGVLRLQCCSVCGRWIWVPGWICPSCHTFDPPWQTVPATGIVYTWTRTRHAFPDAPDFRSAVPYDVLLVALSAANGLRLLGVGIDFAEPPLIGEAVTGVLQRPSESTDGWPVLRWTRACGAAR